MGGDHHHAEDTFKIPKDHRIYKAESSQELMKLKELLAKNGLKDPWIRNEAFRFQNETPFPTRLYYSLGGRFIFYGIGIGLVLSVAQYAWDAKYPPPSHGDNGHH